MFGNHHGDVVLPITLSTSGGSKVSASVTCSSKNGAIYVKIVNAALEAQQITSV
jgi:hypothetical protein